MTVLKYFGNGITISDTKTWVLNNAIQLSSSHLS